MRTFDLAPLYRSTVGFDRLFSLLDQGVGGAVPGYPPYNIERTGDNEYRVTVAVAGFAEPELSVVAKENTLTIRGEKNAEEEEKRGDVLYQGIAARAFERVFQLADFVQVKGAKLENGLLHVDLVREIPEAKKPRTIPIGNGKPAEKAVEQSKLRKRYVSGEACVASRRPGFPGRFFVWSRRDGFQAALGDRRSEKADDDEHDHHGAGDEAEHADRAVVAQEESDNETGKDRGEPAP